MQTLKITHSIIPHALIEKRIDIKLIVSDSREIIMSEEREKEIANVLYGYVLSLIQTLKLQSLSLVKSTVKPLPMENELRKFSVIAEGIKLE